MPLEPIVVGREPKELQKFGTKGTVFLGKHVVGAGFESHMTNPVQMDMARPHVVLIVGKRGSGKCLDGDSLITLGDGSMVPIRELAANDRRQVCSLNEQLKMTSAESVEFFEREVDRLLQVRLRSGREIKLTPEHPLLTIKGWRPAGELGIGSRIATPRRLPAFGDVPMQEHEIKLLAYLIAEGHMSNNFVLFSNMDNHIFEDFRDSVKLFNPTLRIVEHSKPGCYRITKSEEEIARTGSLHRADGSFVSRRSSLRTWLDKLEIYGQLSPNKIIPACVFRLPKEQLALFLNRLFSCDGSIYKSRKGDNYLWEIDYSSASKKLIHQVQNLLLRFGILSKIRHKHVKSGGKIFDTYELVIGTGNILTFVREIGFFGKKVERQISCAEEANKLSRNPNVDTVPKEMWDTYRPKSWADVGRALGYTTFPKAARESQFYSTSRQKLLQIAIADGAENIRMLAESDIFWDEIVAVELLEGHFKVYDITVPELHNFVANDIIVHNSYTGAVLAEEVMLQPAEIRNQLSVVMIDTMGIFWSMKEPNDPALMLLKEWELEPKSFPVQNVVPHGLADFYRRQSIAFDATFAVKPNELSAGDWALTFGVSIFEPLGILLEHTIRSLQGKEYSLADIIKAIEVDKRAEEKDKAALANRFAGAEGWGIFAKEATPIEKFIKPGVATILDVSMQDWPVRNLTVGLLARKLYSIRLAARREEEEATIAGEVVRKVPLTWLIMDEAHNFLPSEGETAATGPLLTLLRQGRQPGISTVFITQRPLKLHEDAIAQSDMVIAHRLTAQPDLAALSTVMQSYALEDIRKLVTELPKQPGSAVLLDDNSERLFAIQVRPRMSWHAGGTPSALR